MSSCGTTGTVGDGPYAVTIYVGTWAYVANSNTVTVTKCDIGVSGALTNCANSGYNAGNRIYYTEVTGEYVFLTAFQPSLVYKCSIAPATGLFSDCSTTGSGFNGPMGVTVG